MPPDDARAQAEQMRAYAKEITSGPSEEDKEYVPPISMMAIAGFTRTDSSLPPPTAPYAPNNNTVLSPFSGFWGGAITDHIGAFAQVTYNAPPPGGFPDPPGLLAQTAPYWRAALEPHWGRHSLMVGTFGMAANVNPWVDPTFALGTMATFPQADRFTDTGFDAQYQYQGGNYWITLRGSYIREFQKLDATWVAE